MIVAMINKPDKIFDHLSDEAKYYWFEISDLLGPAYYVGIGTIKGQKEAAIHFEVLRWSVDILRGMKQHWPFVVAFAKHLGCSALVAANWEYLDKRWPKLIKHFGFPQPKIMAISQQEI